MIQHIKPMVKCIPGAQPVWRGTLRLQKKAAFVIWCLRGKPPGDPYFFYKRDRIIREGNRFGCSTLVETGTYMGDTVEACRHSFRQVHSVELSQEFHRQAKKRFARAPNIKLWQGDSGKVMGEIVQQLVGRAVFWLDGHYSGGNTACGTTSCPIVAELAAIEQHDYKDHLILIDDARLFGHDPAYPTLAELNQLLFSINPGYRINVEDDCIIARPNKEAVQYA